MSSVPRLILLRKDVAAVINSEPDMKLVAKAYSGEEAIESFRIHVTRERLLLLNGVNLCTQFIEASAACR
jgi:hypothetical protein